MKAILYLREIYLRLYLRDFIILKRDYLYLRLIKYLYYQGLTNKILHQNTFKTIIKENMYRNSSINFEASW